MSKFQRADNRKPLNLGLVGCGQVARKHLAALSVLDDRYRLVGAVDPNREARQRASELTGAPGFETLETLLKEHPVDLVTLATPTGLHPEQAMIAAEAGADVLTKKPLGTSLEAAQTMVEHLDELNRSLFVVKQLRHHPLFLAVRDALNQGRFGRLHTIGLQIFWTRPQHYYDHAPWRGTRAMDGGALMNQASHYVDLLDWIFGPVASVHAVGGALGRKIEVEDTAVVTLCWEEGFVGSLHVTMLAYPKNLATSLTVIGEKGSVRLGGPACNRVEAWEFAKARPEDESIGELEEEVFTVLKTGHQRVYRDVAAYLGGDDSPVVDGLQGLRSLAIIDAAYRALEQGMTVDVPRSH